MNDDIMRYTRTFQEHALILWIVRVVDPLGFNFIIMITLNIQLRFLGLITGRQRSSEPNKSVCHFAAFFHLNSNIHVSS
jgi:hypothetical protein